MNELYGVPLIASVYLTVPKEVPRTRRERWLSWPWRPWKRTKWIQVADSMIYNSFQDGKRTLIAHPEVIARLAELAGPVSQGER